MYTDQDCGQNVPITQGHAPFTVEGETFQTWFKIFGSLEGRSHRPLVVLHGGAGLTHHYVLPHQDIAQHDIPVVFYDQLGNGESTHLSEKDQEFWTIDLFIDELLSLVSHLGIQDDFDLLGHSWGGMLSSALVIRRHPPGLKHLILANCLAAKDLWTASECELMLKFSQEVLDGLEKPTTDPEFLKALYTVQGKHGCTVQPFPEDFKRSLEACYGPNGDTTVINAMMRPGQMADWDIRDEIHLIDVPTLIINGANDWVQDFVIEPFFSLIRKPVKWVRFERSSHTPFWEERDRYNEVVRTFVSIDV